MSADEADIVDPLCMLCVTPKSMALIRVTPRLGALPELHTFFCSECGDVRTREISEDIP